MKTARISLVITLTLFFLTVNSLAQTNINSLDIEANRLKQEEIRLKLEENRLEQEANRLMQEEIQLNKNRKNITQKNQLQKVQVITESNDKPQNIQQNQESNPSNNQENEPKIKKDVNSASLDFAVPEVPALAVLGLATEEVVRPTTPRQFATELLNGIDKNGNFQSGVAIDTVPWLFLLGKTSLEDYRRSLPTRLLLNNGFSFVTTKGSSDDDKSIRLAAGIRFVPWNLGDPRTYKLTSKDIKENGGNKIYWIDHCFEGTLDLIRNEINSILKTMEEEDLAVDACVKKNSKLDCFGINGDAKKKDDCEFLVRVKCQSEVKRVAKKNQERINELRSQMDQKLLVGAKQCRKDLRKLTWNRSAWSLGIAPTFISTSGNTDDISWDGLGIWTSLAYGFEGIPTLENTSQFILHARYRTDEEVPIEGMDGVFSEQDSLFFGGRLIVGKDTIAASFEGGYTYIDPKQGPSDHSFMGSVGGNIKIADNVWLDLSIGARTSDDTSKGQVFVLNSIKWGFQSAPTIVPASN